MVIFFFILIRILIILVLGALIWGLIQSPSFKDALNLVYQGFKRGLQGSGLHIPDKSSKIELYQWFSDPQEDICETSEQYAQLPPMDLASWMEKGIPKSVDGECQCDKDCQCQLVCVKKHTFNN